MAQDTIDYAWARPSPSYMKGRGITTVCRYLSWLPNGKVISSAEAAGLLGAGMDIFLNWEFEAKDQLGGAASGGLHAREAVRQAYNLGYPKGATLYFSGDFDITPAQKPIAGAYMRTALDIVHAAGYRHGGYGSYWYIKYLFDNGLIDDGWQAYAWSGGLWDPRANLRQIHNGYPFGGYDVDLDERVGPTYSWLHPAGTNVPAPTPLPLEDTMATIVRIGDAGARPGEAGAVYITDGFRKHHYTDMGQVNAGLKILKQAAWLEITQAEFDALGLVDSGPVDAPQPVDTAALATQIADLLKAALSQADAVEIEAAVVAALQSVQFTPKA